MIFTVDWTTFLVEKEAKKISGSTWDLILTFVMTGWNALSIELIKLTGEQAIVSHVVSGHRIGHPYKGFKFKVCPLTLISFSM